MEDTNKKQSKAIIFGIIVASVTLIMLISFVFLYLYLKAEDNEKSENETASEKESDDKKEFTPLVIATVEPTNVVDNEVVFTKSGQCKQNGSYDSYESYIENPCKIYANDELIYTFPACNYEKEDLTKDVLCIKAFSSIEIFDKYLFIYQSEGTFESISMINYDSETSSLEAVEEYVRSSLACEDSTIFGCEKYELFETEECRENSYLPSCYKFYGDLPDSEKEKIQGNYRFKGLVQGELAEWYEDYWN